MTIGDRKRHEIVAAALDVTVRFGSAVALDRVSLTVCPGAVVALLGPNGAGKTTLVHVLVGLRRPAGGRVVLFGRSPRDWRARRGLGVVLQEMSFLPHSRVVEVLELVRAHHRAPVPVADLLRRFNLETLPHSDLRRLSSGQRRRLVLAMAFAGRPRLLVLDEPFSSLDVDSQALLRHELARHAAGGGSVVMTTHQPEEVSALATHAVLLRGGRVAAAGSVDSLAALAGEFRQPAGPPRESGSPPSPEMAAHTESPGGSGRTAPSAIAGRTGSSGGSGRAGPSAMAGLARPPGDVGVAAPWEIAGVAAPAERSDLPSSAAGTGLPDDRRRAAPSSAKGGLSAGEGAAQHPDEEAG